ncbi:Uncharacterised protein [Enterobacter cloacae]|nr:Uncharacterised protein [Enterobacter cloacae]
MAIVGMHQHDAPDTFFLALHRVVHRVAFAQYAGIDADEGQLANVRIAHQLEGQCRERFIIAWVALGVLSVFVNPINSGHVQWGRHQFNYRVEHALHALVLEGAAAQHGLYFTGDGPDAQPLDDFRFIQFARLKVLIHKLIAGFCRSRNHFFSPRLGGTQQIVRHWRIAERHALRRIIPKNSAHPDEIHHAGEVFFCPHGDHNRDRIGFQPLLHHPHHAEEIRTRAVHFIDERQTRNVIFIRLTPDGLRLRLHATDGVIDHHRTVEHTHGTFHLNGEIHVPGGVDNIDAVRFKASVHTGPETAYRRRRNGDPALLLLRHPVGGCRAIVYFTQLVAHPGVKQDALSSGCFARIDMRGDTDVAITFEWNGSGHDISLSLHDWFVTTGMVACSFVCYNSPIVRVLSNYFLTVDLLLI